MQRHCYVVEVVFGWVIRCRTLAGERNYSGHKSFLCKFGLGGGGIAVVVPNIPTSHGLGRFLTEKRHDVTRIDLFESAPKLPSGIETLRAAFLLPKTL